MQDGCGIGVEGEGLLEGLESGVSDGDGVVAEGNVGEGEYAFRVAIDGEGEGGVRGGEGDVCGGEWAMLRVVNNALELGKDGGARDGGGKQAEKQREKEGFRARQGERTHKAPWSRGRDVTGARSWGDVGRTETSIEKRWALRRGEWEGRGCSSRMGCGCGRGAALART